MVNYRYLNNYRDNNINSVFLSRFNKFIVKKDEDLNDYFKNNITNTINDNTKFSFLKNLIEIKKCNLLSCELKYKGNDIKFENGNLVTITETITNDPFIEIIKELMEKETKEIRTMLCLPLTLNSNLATLGYIMDIELLKIVSFYNDSNIERFSIFLIEELKKINDKESNDDYTPTFQNFPKEHLESNLIYPSYCQWLNILDHSSSYDNKENIPKGYQAYFEKSDNESDLEFLKGISVGDNGNTSLKVISLGNEEEFCESMAEVMQSRNAFTESDLNDLNNFFDSITDHVKYIPNPIQNLENLGHIINRVINHFRSEKPPLDTYMSWLSHFDKTFDNVLTVILAFSNHTDISSDLRKYREFCYFNSNEEEFFLKLLNECPSANRYDELMKKRNIWSRLCDKIYTDNYMNEFPELIKDLLKVSKRNVFNFIFVNRRHMIIDDGRENLDALYKKNIEDALQANELLSSATVKSCNLLNCVITINNTDLEFENGKLYDDDGDDDDDDDEEEEEEAYMKPLKKLMNKVTKPILQKMNLALSLNENISKLGFCVDIPLMKNVAVYDNYEMEEFYKLMVRALQKLTNFKTSYEPPYNDFPREHLSMDLTYKNYCKWLFTLESLKYDQKMIPMSYQTKFEQYKDVEDIKKKLKDVSLKTLSISEENEFYKMMMNIMSASEAISKSDLIDLHSFIKYEENRLKYIPETITNKENLANVINKILLYCMSEPPMEFILPRFNNANDVLRLALVMSGNQASDLGKSVKFKSFKNSDRRLLMELLNHCKNRYEDILKYKDMWERFCERIHPSKFKNRYPDLVKDLQGSYQFLGCPENKEIRMEYRFYHLLIELDDRFKKYREKVVEYIKDMRKKREEDKKKEQEIINNRNENTNEARRRLNSMRSSVLSDPNITLGTKDLLTESEHQTLLRKYKCIKNMPKDIKEYVYHYLLVIAGIAYTNNLSLVNSKYFRNQKCIYWDVPTQLYIVKKGYEEVYEGLPDIVFEVYNGYMPPLNRELLNKRIQELEPSIMQLKEQDHQYKKERQTYSSKCVELIKNKNINEAAKLLSQKPGIYLRHLDELITKSQTEEELKEVKNFFEKVGEKGSVKVLLSIKAYFQKRNEKWKSRAFLIKSNNNNKKKKKNKGGKVNSQVSSAIFYTDRVKDPLKDDLCKELVHICDQALHLKFESKEKLNGVYISPQLQKILIPFDLRNASKSLENYTKGSRFDLSFKNITQEEKEEMIKEAEVAIEKKKVDEMKVYSEKKKHEVDLLNLKSRIEKKTKEIESAPSNGKTKVEIKQMKKEVEKDERIRNRCKKSLDEANVKLTAIGKDLINLQKDLEDKKKCPIGVSYKNIRLFIIGSLGMYLEIYDADFNLKAFIDQQNDDGFNNHKKYNLYYGTQVSAVFADIDIDTILAMGGRYIMVNVNIGAACATRFGWMERDFVHSDEPFEPTTVRQSIELNYHGEACPIVLDCKTREFIWLDYPFAQSYYMNFVRNYHQYHRMMVELKSNNNKPNNTYTNDIIKKYTENYEKYTAINTNVKKSIFAYYLEPLRISVADLIHLHIDARGGKCLETEDELKEGDTAFLPYTPYIKKEKVDYVNCSQLEVILSNYMN